MGTHFQRVAPTFDKQRFVDSAITGLDELELKQRATLIRKALEETLPSDFTEACKLMIAAMHPASDIDLSGTVMDADGVRGWAIMSMAEYVSEHGLDDYETSLETLKELTKRFTAELAIRAFFISNTPHTLTHVERWARDENHHVRRLASEGSRPRLPWALRLPEFIADPTPVVALLETLKDDPEEYVRRSVANNLNDIAKDHPDLVADIARRWLKGASPARKKLVKHACRTLIKQGHTKTLEAFGYSEPVLSVGEITLKNATVELGSHLEFEVSITSDSPSTQPLIIDYVIHHQKANGTTSPKVFKWKTLDLPAGKSLTVSKKHAVKPITTRVYYAGLHQVEIQINGKSFGKADFDLTV
ncbi:MAG: DNA alkylation repair protein [Parvibaculaceae bacterium]|nr:DNA alkylation repair protein [Parvibaculaceae bacterium]